ncbi:MAG: hypothetical protein R8M46_03630 [Ghiorsea sp.]
MRVFIPVLATVCLLFFLTACSETIDPIEPKKVEGNMQEHYQKNAVDAVGVAKGNKKISPYGKPAY